MWRYDVPDRERRLGRLRAAVVGLLVHGRLTSWSSAQDRPVRRGASALGGSYRTVLLLEAGPDYGSEPAVWPAELRDPSGIWPDSHPWGYVYAKRPADKPLLLPCARVVGGSSTINACLWLRGSAADYDAGHRGAACRRRLDLPDWPARQPPLHYSRGRRKTRRRHPRQRQLVDRLMVTGSPERTG